MRNKNTPVMTTAIKANMAPRGHGDRILSF